MPGRNAYEIAEHMTWNVRANGWPDFPVKQKWFAVGECMSHLDYLRKRNRVHQEIGMDGKRRYFIA